MKFILGIQQLVWELIMYPERCHDPYLRKFIRLTKSLPTDYDGDVLWLRKAPQFQPMVIAFNLKLIVFDYLSHDNSPATFDLCNIVLTTFEQTRLFMVMFDVLFTKPGSAVSNGHSLIDGAILSREINDSNLDIITDKLFDMHTDENDEAEQSPSFN